MNIREICLHLENILLRSFLYFIRMCEMFITTLDSVSIVPLREDRDRISLLSFFQNKESRLNRKHRKLNK
jgi:hypothetical protein